MGEYIPSAYANKFTLGEASQPMRADGEPLDADAAARIARLVEACAAVGNWQPLDALVGPAVGPTHDDPESVGRLVEYHLRLGHFARARAVVAAARVEAESSRRFREERERAVRQTGDCTPDLVELAEFLNERTLAILERNGIVTTTQLVAKTEDELREMPNLGPVGFEQIVRGLERVRVRHSWRRVPQLENAH